MDLCYKVQKDFSASELESLFLSVHWDSGRFPARLVTAMHNSSAVISAWDGDRLVGLVRSLDDGATVAFIHYLLVRPEYQRFHIGSELMKRLMAKYTDYLYIKIIPSDPATIPFYEKFGFAQYDNYSAMVINRTAQAKDELPR